MIKYEVRRNKYYDKGDNIKYRCVFEVFKSFPHSREAINLFNTKNSIDVNTDMTIDTFNNIISYDSKKYIPNGNTNKLILLCENSYEVMKMEEIIRFISKKVNEIIILDNYMSDILNLYKSI